MLLKTTKENRVLNVGSLDTKVFRHLESTQNSQKFELSSCNEMEEQKEFMFVTTVCVLFLIKLRWPKKNNLINRFFLIFMYL